MEKIPHSSPIFRAIRSKRWKSEPSNAFLLRSNETELSVITKADCSRVVCFAQLNTCFGEFSSIVQKIEKLGFEVVSRPLPANPYHAVIVNLPLNTDETLKEAERAATLLAKEFSTLLERAK